MHEYFILGQRRGEIGTTTRTAIYAKWNGYPEEDFASLFDSAKARFNEVGRVLSLDEAALSSSLLSDAFYESTDNDATRAHLETKLARAPDDVAIRFVILSYYYQLSRFNHDLKGEYIAHLRTQFRRDLALFVRLRRVDDWVEDISWEITNACAIRDWTRVKALFAQLGSTGRMERGRFRAEFGYCLFRATFAGYDPEGAVDDDEMLSNWKMSAAFGAAGRGPEEWSFSLSMLVLGEIGTRERLARLEDAIYSVRIGLDYRAFAVIKRNQVLWVLDRQS